MNLSVEDEVGIFEDKKWRIQQQQGVPAEHSCHYQILADLVGVQHPAAGKGVRLVTQKVRYATAQHAETLESWRSKGLQAVEEGRSPRLFFAEWCRRKATVLEAMRTDSRFPFTAEESTYVQIEAHIFRAMSECYKGQLVVAQAHMERARSALHALIENGTTLFPQRVSAVRFEEGKVIRG